MLSRSRAARARVPLLLAAIGVAGSIIAKVCHYSWIETAMPGLVGLLATVITRATSERTVSRLARYFERWSELGHDAQDLWQEGERFRWAGTQVAKNLERLTERERNYHSQEYDAPNARILEECQRELWAEIGQPYA
jgi:hypothetical protein